MGMLDSLKSATQNPLVENNLDMEFALEADFEYALEKAIDVKLSESDIAAILNGTDDVDDDDDGELDLDDSIGTESIDIDDLDAAIEAALSELDVPTKDDSDLDLDDDDKALDEVIYDFDKDDCVDVDPEMRDKDGNLVEEYPECDEDKDEEDNDSSLESILNALQNDFSLN